jgi:hypothetical protein
MGEKGRDRKIAATGKEECLINKFKITNLGVKSVKGEDNEAYKNIEGMA